MRVTIKSTAKRSILVSFAASIFYRCFDLDDIENDGVSEEKRPVVDSNMAHWE